MASGRLLCLYRYLVLVLWLESEHAPAIVVGELDGLFHRVELLVLPNLLPEVGMHMPDNDVSHYPFTTNIGLRTLVG